MIKCYKKILMSMEKCVKKLNLNLENVIGHAMIEHDKFEDVDIIINLLLTQLVNQPNSLFVS